MATLINKLNDPNAAAAASQEVRQQGVPKRGTDFQSLMQSLSQNKSAQQSNTVAASSTPETAQASETPQPQGSVEERIKNAVNDAAKKYNLPPALILGFIKQESGFNPKARSWCGAQGLMQLMPGTAKNLGVQDPWNIEQNIEGGAKYVRQNLDHFGGDLKKAIAAYNAGPGAVEKYNGVPPFKETQNYVPAVMAHYEKFSGGPVDFSVPGDYTPPKKQMLDLNLVSSAVQGSEMLTQAATALAITANAKPIDLPKPSQNEERPPPPPPPSAVRV